MSEAKSNETIAVETNRENLKLLYLRTYMFRGDTTGITHAIGSLIEKLEDLGFEMNDEDGVGSIHAFKVPENVRTNFTRRQVKAVLVVLQGAARPGSKEQLSFGIIRDKILPLAKDFGIYRKVHETFYGGASASLDKDDAFLDRELDEVKNEPEDKDKPSDGEKKE